MLLFLLNSITKDIRYVANIGDYLNVNEMCVGETLKTLYLKTGTMLSIL